jgi:hypothetical protein
MTIKKHEMSKVIKKAGKASSFARWQTVILGEPVSQ